MEMEDFYYWESVFFSLFLRETGIAVPTPEQWYILKGSFLKYLFWVQYTCKDHETRVKKVRNNESHKICGKHKLTDRKVVDDFLKLKQVAFFLKEIILDDQIS